MTDPDPLLLPATGCSQWIQGVDEKLGFWQASMSLVAVMLGTGIVAYPYAFALGGYVAGPIMFFIIAELSYLSYRMLIQCTIVEHVSSYGALLRSLPQSWAYYSNLALSLLLILAATSYVLIAASMIRSFFPVDALEESFILQDKVLFGLILLSLFPLCLFKSFHGLSAVSTYCSCAIVTVAVLIVWKAINIWLNDDPLPQNLLMTAQTQPRSIALCVPIFGCSMFGHMNMSQVYAEMQPKVKKQAHLVALSACGLCGALYMAVGFSGYAAFGRSAEADIVSQIIARAGEDHTTFLLQFLLVTFVISTTPLLILPLRNMTVECLAPGVNPVELSSRIHVLLTFGLLACVYLALIVMPNLGEVLDILGATCVIPLCFVVPARISWSLEDPRPVAKCIIMAVIGVLASAVSLFVIATS